MIYLLLSFDDATKYAVKCAKLLDRYDLRGTFYFDIIRMKKELKVDEVKWIASWNEIGAHSVTHRDLTRLTKEEVLYEVRGSKTILERIIEKTVRSFAYPYGKFNQIVVEIVKLCGFENARTTKPFNITPIIYDPYTIGVSFYTDPHAYRALPKAVRTLRMSKLLINPWLLKRWYNLIIEFLEHNHNSAKVYLHILIHPYLIEYRREWNKIELLFERLKSFSITNLTISEYVNKIQG